MGAQFGCCEGDDQPEGMQHPNTEPVPQQHRRRDQATNYSHQYKESESAGTHNAFLQSHNVSLHIS